MRRTARVPFLLVAAAAGTAMLTACGPDSTNTAATSATAAANAKIAALSLPKGVSNATAIPSAVPNENTLRKTVALTACQKVTGGWQAAGTATNHASEAADYTITVFFTTSGATVIGTGDAHVHVDAGKSADWTATGTFTAPPTTQCVVRGVG